MGKSTISMAIFNSFLYVYQRINLGLQVENNTLPSRPWGVHNFSKLVPSAHYEKATLVDATAMRNAEILADEFTDLKIAGKP